MSAKNRFRAFLTVSLVFLATISVAKAQYSGGSGTADDPYRIATAADLIALGETPDDYDKHFLLTADIDLDLNLVNEQVFTQIVIPDSTGALDGSGHSISHLRIMDGGVLGLPGRLASGAVVRNRGSVDVTISGSFSCVGGLV